MLSIKARVKPGEGVHCDWRGTRTDRSVTLPPPPGRRVPRRNSNNGEGAPWSLVQGRAGTLGKPLGQVWGSGDHGGFGGHGGTGDSGGHGGSGDSGSHDGTEHSGSHGHIIFWEGLDRGAIVTLTKAPCMVTMATRTTAIYLPPPKYIFG